MSAWSSRRSPRPPDNPESPRARNAILDNARHLPQRAAEKIRRLCPGLSPPGRAAKGRMAAGRLLAEATRGKEARRMSALNRLIALGDPGVLALLLSAWDRLTHEQRQRVLAFAGQSDHPQTAALFWRLVALRHPDPPGEMARLAGLVGPALVKALGRELAGDENRDWAWESLVRLGSDDAHGLLLDCLDRGDELAERARRHFTAAGSEVLPILMRTARSHSSWDVRLAAVTILLRRKEPVALKFLTELLRDREWYTDGLGWDLGPAKPWPVLFGLSAPRDAGHPAACGGIVAGEH